MSDGGTKGNGNTCAHLGGLWAATKNIKDSQLSARLYKYKSGVGRDEGHSAASEHGVRGLEGRTDWREFTVQDMCGLGYELNQRNIEAECWGDSPTITLSPNGKPMEVKELREKDVRADATKGPFGRVLCDIGEYTLADGTVKRGNDHTRCCRPRQPGLSIPYSEKYGTPECNSDGACKSGGVAASILGSPQSVSIHNNVRGSGAKMAGTGSPHNSDAVVSGYDLFKYGHYQPRAESSCHLYLIDSCANATPFGVRGCQIRFEEKQEGGEWFGYRCDWWDEDHTGPKPAKCYSKKDLANNNIYQLDPTDTSACNCFDRTGEFAIPCGDFWHASGGGVGTDENVIETANVKGYTSSGNAQIGTTAITSGNQWYIPYSTPSSGKTLKFKYSADAATNYASNRLKDPRAREYPAGTKDNVKRAMGHIQGVGSGRYIGQYSPCREASNAGQHGCPSDVDTTFWGS